MNPRRICRNLVQGCGLHDKSKTSCVSERLNNTPKYVFWEMDILVIGGCMGVSMRSLALRTQSLRHEHIDGSA